jgi:hypothetical protein
MKVNTEGTSRKSLIPTGEVELVEFFTQRRTCDHQDRGMACSVARALVRGARNALLTVTPLWLARSLGGWQGESSPQLKTRRARERPSRRICSARVRTRPDGTTNPDLNQAPYLGGHPLPEISRPLLSPVRSPSSRNRQCGPDNRRSFGCPSIVRRE